MIPQKRSPIVQIPITFDSSSKPQGLTNDKFYLSLLVFGIWVFCAIVLIVSALTISEKILYGIGSFIVATLIIRFVLMRENYFKKKRMDLVEKDFKYPYSVFWNIYEVTSSYPHICRYANGLKSVFVVFDYVYVPLQFFLFSFFSIFNDFFKLSYSAMNFFFFFF